MGPIGIPEMMFIMALALLIFGPRKLPELGRTLGRGMAEFRKASNELKRTVNAEMIQEEIRQSTEVIREHDPRRMLRDALKEAPEQVRDRPNPVDTAAENTAAENTAEPDPEPSTETASEEPSSTATDSAKPEGPEGTVARSRGSSPATREPSSNTSPSSS